MAFIVAVLHYIYKAIFKQKKLIDIGWAIQAFALRSLKIMKELKERKKIVICKTLNITIAVLSGQSNIGWTYEYKKGKQRNLHFQSVFQNAQKCCFHSDTDYRINELQLNIWMSLVQDPWILKHWSFKFIVL